MIRRIVMLLVFLLGSAAPARAQGEIVAGAWIGLGVAAVAHVVSHGCCAEANVGSTVRFTDSRTGVRDITGVIRTIDPDSMTVATDDSTWRGPLAAMQALRTRTTERKWAEGWVIGFITGASAGAVLGAVTPTEDNGDFYINRQGLIAIGAAGGAFVGSLIGTLIGAANTGQHWQSVPRSRVAAAVFVSPTTKRVGLRVSIH